MLRIRRAVIVVAVCLVVAPCPRVDAFQIFMCDQGYGFPSSLSSGYIMKSGRKRCALDGMPPKYKTMRMASPMVEKDLNGDAPHSEDGQYPRGESGERPSSRNSITASDDVSSNTTKLITSSRRQQHLPINWLGEKNYILFTAVLIGVFTGINIAAFKTAVEFVREVLYGDGVSLQLVSPYIWNSGGVGGGGEEFRTLSLRPSEVLPISVIPAVGGLIVGLLLRFSGDMPPGLRDAVREGMTLFHF